ncbi:MAG: GlsB/YeaQ/YmgE family stress response membrane protein [Candidatus Saccharimonas sp.]
MLLDIVLWILFGALAGWVASMVMKTDAQMGGMANVVVGIVGAFIGGFLVRTLTGTAVEGFNLMSLLVAILGAIILLAIVKAASNRNTRRV